MKKMQRNSFFVSDRIIGSAKYDIIYRTPIIVKVLKAVRARKRQEKKLMNLINVAKAQITNLEPKKHHNIFKNTSEQIQNGFDIATKWKEAQNDN